MASSTRDITETVWDAVALVDLPAKKYFKIGEVAALVGVEPHVLRYWQTQFRQVRPQKSRSGHRQYRRRDVETLLAIKELLHVQRFTIAGAKNALKVAPSGLPRAAPSAATTTTKTVTVGNAAKASISTPVDVVTPTYAAPDFSREPVPHSAQANATVPPVSSSPSSSPSSNSASKLTTGVVVEDNIEVDVVALDSESQIVAYREQELAEQTGEASARIEFDADVTATIAEPVTSTALAENAVTPSGVPPSDVPPSDMPPSDMPPSDVPPSDMPPSVATSGALMSTAVAPGELAPSNVERATTSAGEVDLETPRHRVPSTQQLGFGFVPTAREMLARARREALEILSILERDDAADQRHVGKN